MSEALKERFVSDDKMSMLPLDHDDEIMMSFTKDEYRAIRAALSDTGEDFTPLRLPKIDAETLDLLGDTDLIEDGGWTQVAVDFGCLLNEHRWAITPPLRYGGGCEVLGREAVHSMLY